MSRGAWKSAILVVALALLASQAMASGDPVTERGFSPEKVYQFGNLDSINLFNGNLIVSLPIGQTYPVSSKFGYQLMLSYNSNVWDLSTGPIGDPGFCNGGDGYLYIPNRKSNAGMGWSLGFGRLFPACHPANEGQNMPPIVFESPDGGSHSFQSSGDNGNTRYTIDNSHLRLRFALSDNPQLDFPDGTTYTYQKNGCGEYSLLSMRDASGNTVTITWDAGRYNQTITDPYGRKTLVHYVNTVSNDAYDRVISYIDVPVFAAGTTDPAYSTGRYWFDYIYPRLDLPTFSAPCYQYTFVTPMLYQIRRPDGSAFKFEYGNPGITSNHIGTLLVLMTLPTKGQIEWYYDGWEIPGQTCDPLVPWPVAVGVRTFHDPLKGTTDTWQYSSVLDAGPFDNDPYYCPMFPDNQPGQWPKEQKRTIVLNPRGDKTVHYFSVWRGRKLNDPDEDGSGLSPHGYHWRDLGLSMSKLVPAVDGAWLSSRSYDCGGTGTCDDANPDRSTYLLYEQHVPPNAEAWVIDPWNALPKKTRTIFHKDITSTGAAYVDTSSSDYDGYGHYRVVTTSGNFGPNGAVQSQTVTTNYNSVEAEVGDPAAHWEIKPGSGTWGVDFTPYPSTEPWILGTFTSVKTEENGHSSKQLFLFDRYSGFLSRTRLRRGTAAADGRYTDTGNGQKDLLTVFEQTALVSGIQAVGEIAAETHYGGDLNLLPDTTLPLFDVDLGAAPAGMRTTYTYKYGSAATSQKVGAPYGTINVDPDKNTGFPRSSTDPAGHVTSLEFDSMARVSKLTQPSGTYSDYTYPISDRAYAISTTKAANGTELLKSTYGFDGFGRVAIVKNLMADGTESQATATWNALGQKTSETAPAPAGSTGVSTTYTYDAFGRPLTVTPPDGAKHAVTYQYGGSRTMTVTYGKVVGGAWGGIGTSVDYYGDVIEEPASIAYQEFDVFSRLAKITQYGQGGAATTATYAYDVGGRMTKATVSASEGTQPDRSFIHDNRGFLVSQTNPESGTTTFQNYDALGNVGRRIQGSVGGTFDLTFVYDIYQRLTEIYQGSTLLKQITFDELPAGDPQWPYSQRGQIVKTYRRNHHAELGGDVPVYTWLRYDSAGRLNEKKTRVGSAPTFTQTYGYNELDAVASLGYPSCTGCTPLAAGASIPNRTLSFRWSHGYLLGVDEGTNHFTSSLPGKDISYWPNGMLKSLTHVDKTNGHETTDSQTLDQGMARPGTITFSGVSTCTPPSSTITAPSSMQAGGTSTASVTATSGATYAWTIQNGTIIGGQGTSGITFTAFCGNVNVTLGVTVTLSGCSGSSSKTIATTGGSGVVATVTGTQTITSGGSGEIFASFSGGTPPYTVTWSDGVIQENIPYTYIWRWVQPTTTTTYTVTAVSDANGCGTTTGSAVVTVSGSCTPSNASISGPSSVAAGGIFTVTMSQPPSGAPGWGTQFQGAYYISSSGNSYTFQAYCYGAESVVVTYSISAGPNNCASEAVKTIPIVKSTGSVTGTQTIDQGGGAWIYAYLTGPGPWTLIWSDGFSQTVSASPAQRWVTPGSTTTYTLVGLNDGNGCEGNKSGSAVISVRPLAPANLSALATSTTQINVSWQYSGSADRFDLYRNGGLIYSGSALSYPDTGVAAGTAYWYKVVAVKSGTQSLDSNRDIATTVIFANDPIAVGVTSVAAQHILQLRTAVNAVRVLSGLSATTWGEAIGSGTIVRAAHITELRTILDDARQRLLLPAIAYERTPLTAGMFIKVRDVVDLRNGVK